MYYFQEEINLIEFPIFIYPSQKKDTKLMPFELPVIAVATKACGISISPPFIDFGTVNATESAKAEINISNNSLIPQHYCFIDIPEVSKIPHFKQFLFFYILCGS